MTDDRKYPYRGPWNDFAVYLMTERGISQAELGRRLSLGERGQALVQSKLVGRGEPPDDEELRRWAAALECDEYETDKLLFLGGLQRAPKRIQEMILHLKKLDAARVQEIKEKDDRIKSLEAAAERDHERIAELAKRNAELVALADQVGKLTDGLAKASGRGASGRVKVAKKNAAAGGHVVKPSKSGGHGG